MIPPGTQATVGAGARLIDVYDRLWQKRRTIPAGSCPSVGVGGLALGGGIGFSSRAFGTTSDNVLALRVVDAGGRVLDCDASHHADLYWACRGGGGGNFGIADLVPLQVASGRHRDDLHRRMAVGAGRAGSRGVAAMGAARARRDLLGLQRLDGNGGPARRVPSASSSAARPRCSRCSRRSSSARRRESARRSGRS